jgi:hypothetical protein
MEAVESGDLPAPERRAGAGGDLLVQRSRIDDLLGHDGRRGGLKTMTEHQRESEWNVADWHGKMLVDRNGEKIGKLQDV